MSDATPSPSVSSRGPTPHIRVLEDVASGKVSAPSIYANGFALGLTNADVVIVLQQNNQPVAILNLSYTLAKTLAQRMGRLVADLEDKIGNPLVTTEKIDELFQTQPEKP